MYCMEQLERQRCSIQLIVQTVGLNMLLNGAKVFKETVTLYFGV